jgi:hypothetical protein
VRLGSSAAAPFHAREQRRPKAAAGGGGHKIAPDGSLTMPQQCLCAAGGLHVGA